MTSNGLTDVQRVARKLLAGLYHNPQHIGRVEAEEPIMPDNATDTLWSLFCEVNEPDGFDTARVENKLNGNIEGANARKVLDRIRQHDILGPVEAASFGHKGEQLEQWARTLAEHAAKQRLAISLGSIASEIRDPNSELGVEEIQTRVLSETQEIVGQATKGGLQHVSEYEDEVESDVQSWLEGEKVDFLPTGFYSLDNLITGIPFRELTIFAACSGAGKTSWLIQLLMQVARRDRNEAVCLFSIEMPAKKVIHRAAAAWGAYELSMVRSNPQAHSGNGDSLSFAELHREYLGRLNRLPIYIDEDPEPTLGQITSRVMQVQAHHDVALVGVDYDEKVDPEDAPPNEELRVSKISKGLKVSAKRLDCACVALSQYNSAPSSRVRPGTNDDLRYSRKKKHEASLIIHWYWPHYWFRSGELDVGGDDWPQEYDPNRPERGFINIGKNRDGRPGQVPLDFYANQTRFSDPNDPETGTNT